MEAPVMPPAEDIQDFVNLEDQELDVVAYELWQRASCPETPVDIDILEKWYHATCL